MSASKSAADGRVQPNPSESTSSRAAAQPLLRVTDLDIRFPVAGFRRPPLHVVKSVSFEVARGTTLGIVGESGSGKTTVVRGILGLVPVAGGTVTLDGTTIIGKGPVPRSVRRTTAIIFQDPGGSLNPRHRIERLVAEPMIVNGIGTRRSRRTRTRELLDRCGLDGASLRRFPHQLSGGQRQRVAIARGPWQPNRYC